MEQVRGRWREGGGKVTERWGGEMLGQYYKVQLDRSNRIPASLPAFDRCKRSGRACWVSSTTRCTPDLPALPAPLHYTLNPTPNLSLNPVPACLWQVYKIRTRLLGIEHHDTLDSLAQLADLYSATDRCGKCGTLGKGGKL